ncbi:MAG: hypothetical protein K2J88_03290, partial [Oscillospiraceae bacterium]|nr:hypothetical protein [Oscillospiraceae bacterium]
GFVGGAFVKCYAKNHSRILWFFLLLLVSVLQTVSVVFICTERGCLYYPQFDSMASLPSLIIALLILSLFHSKNYGDSGLHSFFAGASGGTLSALILGDIMIDFLMPSIAENFPDTKNLLFVGFLAVPVIFILCCTIGLFLQIPIFIVHAVTDDVYEEDEDDDDEEELEKPEKIPVQKQKPIRALDPIEVVSSETVSIKYKSMKRVQEPTALVPIRESIPKAEPVNKPVNKSEHQASLDEILKEQKISAISTKDSISVDELIAKITK